MSLPDLAYAWRHSPIRKSPSQHPFYSPVRRCKSLGRTIVTFWQERPDSPVMKTSLDHLPERKRREIDRVKEILLEEFESAMTTANGRRRRGRVYKIILFGSYARGEWVDEKTGKGYQSDFDILVIVSHAELTDGKRFWWAAEDRMLHDKVVRTPAQVIVHTLDEVNRELRKGQYYFRDIKNEGIALYEFEGTKASGNRRHALAEPGNLTPQEAHDISKGYFDRVLPYGRKFMKSYRLHLDDGDYEHAAFLLHQATEFAYKALLLTLTLYSPPGHNLNKFRGLAEELDRGLVAAWPRGRSPYDGWFQSLRRAYTDARYSEHFEITMEALDWLGERVEHLHNLIEAACKERLAQLAKDAGVE